jgi:hypothetical protein
VPRASMMSCPLLARVSPNPKYPTTIHPTKSQVRPRTRASPVRDKELPHLTPQAGEETNTPCHPLAATSLLPQPYAGSPQSRHCHHHPELPLRHPKSPTLGTTCSTSAAIGRIQSVIPRSTCRHERRGWPLGSSLWRDVEEQEEATEQCPQS